MLSNPFTIRWIVFISLYIIILGSILHFTYELSDQNNFVASFSATNESVWEHLKLLLYPTLLACLIQYGAIRSNNLGPGILAGLLVGMFTIIFLFYGYVGAISHPNSILVIDILIFIISGILTAIISTYIFSKSPLEKYVQLISWIGIVLLFIMFTVFTYKPPNVPILIPPPE